MMTRVSRPDAVRSGHLIRWAEDLSEPVLDAESPSAPSGPDELVAARHHNPQRVCPKCGGEKFIPSRMCQACTAKNREEMRKPGRKTVKLEDLQDLYWSSEKAERDLLPLLLFRGHWSLGYVQSLWNLTQALKAAEVTGYVGAAAFVRENPDVVHASGLHPCATDLHPTSSSIGDKLWRLGNRVASSSNVARLDPETAEYLRFLANASRRMVFTYQPIPRYSPWSRQAWRRPSPAPPTEPLPEYWPFFREATEGLDGADLLLAVDAVVPRTLPKQVREDVCQDLVLGVLEGEITAEDLKDRHQDYIKGVFRRFPVKYGNLSLDAPPPWDRNGRTLAETLVAP